MLGWPATSNVNDDEIWYDIYVFLLDSSKSAIHHLTVTYLMCVESETAVTYFLVKEKKYLSLCCYQTLCFFHESEIAMSLTHFRWYYDSLATNRSYYFNLNYF